MKAVKEKGLLPHCSREESERILELRSSVSELSKAMADIQLKYHSPSASEKDRKELAQKFAEVSKEISSKYSKLLCAIVPIVAKAPESAEDPATVSDELRAAELYKFWTSFLEYPSANWKLANLCIKIGDFKEKEGEPKNAQSYYKEAILRCDTAAEIVRGSRLGYPIKVNFLVEIENLRYRAANKAGDEEELRKLSASRAIRMAFFVKGRIVEQPQQNLSKLLEKYYGPEPKQENLDPLLRMYFKAPNSPEKRKKGEGVSE